MPSMPPPIPDDQDDTSEAKEIVLGVDTHKDRHAAAVLSTLGVLLGSNDFPATAAGYRALLAWASTFGILRRAGVEGTGSYGAALARYLRAAGIEVIEVNAPDKATHRRQGKTDPVDAQAAARAVLSGRASATAKAGDGPVEMLRGVHVGQGLRGQGPHPGHQPTRKPSWWPPTQPCARRCRT